MKSITFYNYIAYIVCVCVCVGARAHACMHAFTIKRRLTYLPHGVTLVSMYSASHADHSLPIQRSKQ